MFTANKDPFLLALMKANIHRELVKSLTEEVLKVSKPMIEEAASKAIKEVEVYARNQNFMDPFVKEFVVHITSKGTE